MDFSARRAKPKDASQQPVPLPASRPLVLDNKHCCRIGRIVSFVGRPLLKVECDADFTACALYCILFVDFDHGIYSLRKCSLPLFICDTFNHNPPAPPAQEINLCQHLGLAQCWHSRSHTERMCCLPPPGFMVISRGKKSWPK